MTPAQRERPVVIAMFMRVSPQTGKPVVTEAWPADQLPGVWELRMRLNLDMRGILVRFPPGTTPEQVFQASDLLSDQERAALYEKAGR
ncbi:hypothetical protein [Microcystis phage Mae-Yong1326-1]|nr:hypothetical protein [Microcystis phage Mae-Yong1326-1]